MDAGGGAMILGRYRLIDRRPAGRAWGERVMARDLRLDCPVDVVVAPAPLGAPEGDLFARRARVAAALQHPAFPFVHDMGVEDNRPVLVYGRIAGRTLADALAHEPTGWSAGRALQFVAGLADALGMAHAAGLCHGSLDVAGVVVQPDGSAALVDLVWPRPARDADGPGVAPEVRDGRAPGPRADVYALGALLRLLLADADGRGSGDDVYLLDAHRLVRRAMARRPEDRYAGGAELAGAIRACLAGLPDAHADVHERPMPVAALPAPTPIPAPYRRRGAAVGTRRAGGGPASSRRPIAGNARAVALLAALTLWPLAHVVAHGVGMGPAPWGRRPGLGQPFGRWWPRNWENGGGDRGIFGHPRDDTRYPPSPPAP